LPAWQAQRHPRRTAWAARDVEGAAQQAYPLAAADDSEAAALRSPQKSARHFEAVAVVLDVQLDAAATRCQHDVDAGRIAVLADIREPLLKHADQRDLLRRSHGSKVPGDTRPSVDSRSLAQRRRFCFDDGLQRAP
jgi:hypothetical protein